MEAKEPRERQPGEPKRAMRVEQAARNNALWCDTICRTHGRPGEFQDQMWLSRHQTPRFFPNAVTLSTQGSATQLARIQDIIAPKLPGDWAVKDSFCTLDLAQLAFRLLFEAAWLWRFPSLPKPKGVVSGIHWANVQVPRELVRWETAWSGHPADDPSTVQARIFLPALLADKDIAFIAAYQDEQIVAGAIANRAGGVVGVCNVFVPADKASFYWGGCVAAIIDVYPGLPLVGYERARELTIAQALGFDVLAPLRVWVRTSPPT